ncbi:MAG TPA: SbcC/MukB-like Walker B domain-containing protein, partial [Propionibacteriaceae bacterium]|nr:SbcC/MukB-like Walker B domain-containing protein [Propionibacteriaceae bacterium]
QLNKQQQLITSRVDKINDSLTAIDYSPGRYIRLLAERSPNTEIRDFRSELRACTDNVVGGDGEQYSEHKFLQVKRLVDRFRGREGLTELDRAWTRRVTDVRNWFTFTASERWRSDDSEHESYADSDGKSGGQKEKLAYTILAASLAYQFRLDWGVERSRAFRFVTIDEAFSRGSEESTRYALELFTRLGLQLMIVTPLQKIRVIDPYVSAVGFVDNPTGAHSRLQGLTITEYRRRQAEHLARSGRSAHG